MENGECRERRMNSIMVGQYFLQLDFALLGFLVGNTPYGLNNAEQGFIFILLSEGTGTSDDHIQVRVRPA